MRVTHADPELDTLVLDTLDGVDDVSVDPSEDLILVSVNSPDGSNGGAHAASPGIQRDVESSRDGAGLGPLRTFCPVDGSVDCQRSRSDRPKSEPLVSIGSRMRIVSAGASVSASTRTPTP